MPVFKLSIKVLQKNIPGMLIYLFVFIVISLLFAGLMPKQTEVDFNQSKVNLVFISHDESILIDGFKENLSRYAKFIDIEDNREALQDAMFFASAQYIVRIPEGFTKSIMNKEPINLEKTTVTGSASSAYIDTTINQFFNIAKMYLSVFPNITQEELVELVKDNMAKEVSVSFVEDDYGNKGHMFRHSYFNYLAYSMFAVLVLGIGSVLIVLNKRDIKMRNMCAPVSQFKIKLQFLLAHLLFTVIIWAIMMFFYMIFDKGNFAQIKTLYYMLNAFVFALTASSVSFLIGNLLKNKNTLSAVSNVVTLGPSFISGIFVPQEFLGSTVLRIASFTPTYWYAKGNGIIANINVFNLNNLKPVISSMMVQIGFAIVFLSISLVLSKRRELISN
ncbi:UNVERIFIED_CONTAM: ABC-2 type transport system permease protein [Acetivibrio alkalicellulosi]